jgi:hypothetical protein
MFGSIAVASSITSLQFAAAGSPAPPAPQAFQLLTLHPAVRPFLYQEYAAHQILSQLSELPENWDGYGAAPIECDTANNAHRALNVLLLSAPVPEITPNTNGTVSFEWESRFGHAHLEIGRTRFSFYVRLAAGPTVPCDGDTAGMERIMDVLGSSIISPLLYPATGAQLTAMTSIAK